MKKCLLFLLSIIPIFAFCQARIVVNNNAFVLIANGAKIVIENPNPNALTVTGSGGNIVSEGQNNQIIWNISNTTGNYTIPWTTKPLAQGGNGVKIPMEMNITSAGNAGGRFVFSTYETVSDANTLYPTYPTTITTMNGGSPDADQSLGVVDRFWILDNTSYTTIPDATLSFGYDDNANEIGGSNTITEANLKAQRWNITATSWEGSLFGTTNTATNVTSAINAVAADFFPVWILVDLNVPLPVNLESQHVENIDCENTISWTVSQEINCSHYEVKRSYDAENWESIATINGAGNSSEEIHYSVRDDSFNTNGIVYYRIEQVDFNGQVTKFETQATNAFCKKYDQPVIFPNPTKDFVHIKSNLNGHLNLFDATGRIVAVSEINTISYTLDLTQYANGLYTIQIILDKEEYNFKIIKN